MEFKNTKPTAADFFRKYSNLIKEAEESEGDKEVDKDIKKLEKDQEKDVEEYKKDKESKECKDEKKEEVKENTYRKMMGDQAFTESFASVEKQVAKNPKVKNPAAVAAAIGRKKLGQKEMTRRSVAGRKDESIEEEQVDEVSGELLGRYIQKARGDISKKVAHSKELDADPKAQALAAKRSELYKRGEYDKRGNSKHQTAISKTRDDENKRKKKLDPNYPKSVYTGKRNTGIDTAIKKLRHGNLSNVQEKVDENWDKKDTVSPSKKGMFKGKTKAELKSKLSNIKKSGPHEKGSAEYTKEKEINFALRAKNNWGKAKESIQRDIVKHISEAKDLIKQLNKKG